MYLLLLTKLDYIFCCVRNCNFLLIFAYLILRYCICSDKMKLDIFDFSDALLKYMSKNNYDLNYSINI